MLFSFHSQLGYVTIRNTAIQNDIVGFKVTVDFWPVAVHVCDEDGHLFCSHFALLHEVITLDLEDGTKLCQCWSFRRSEIGA